MTHRNGNGLGEAARKALARKAMLDGHRAENERISAEVARSARLGEFLAFVREFDWDDAADLFPVEAKEIDAVLARVITDAGDFYAESAEYRREMAIRVLARTPALDPDGKKRLVVRVLEALSIRASLDDLSKILGW